MNKYYRFDHDQPRMGEEVHCFKSLEVFKEFASMMRRQDNEFHRVKFWKIEGVFIKEDDGDAIIRVHTSKQIEL